jgi:hypothetical protein
MEKTPLSGADFSQPSTVWRMSLCCNGHSGFNSPPHQSFPGFAKKNHKMEENNTE